MTPGILILEGADASGKSTLARHLRDHCGARWVRTHPARDQWRHHLAAYLRATALAAAGHLVVVERHWLSECAYAAALPGVRGPCQYPVAARCFDRLWLRAAALYVMCIPSDPLAQLARHRAGVPGKVETFRSVQAVVAYYLNLWHGLAAHPGHTYLDQWVRFGDWRARTDVIRYDVNRDGSNLDNWCRIALRRLARRRREQLPIGLDPTTPNLGGHADRARVVLVGEAPSPSAHPRAAFPFVDRCSHPSSATWLNRALHELGAAEPDLLFVNAVGPELARVVAARPRARYVAMGRVAEAALRELGIQGPHVPHPQWARRFAAHESYAKLLEGVLR